MAARLDSQHERTRSARRPAIVLGIVVLLLGASCGGVAPSTTEPLAPPLTTTSTRSPLPREFSQRVEIGSNGLSEILRFEVPPATRSVFIEATGEPDDMIALGSLRLVDGQELFGVENFGDVRTLLDTTVRNQTGRSVPGLTFQEAGQGRFAWIYGQTITPGEITLQVASTGEAIDLEITFFEANGANRLALDVFVVNGVETFLIPGLVPLVTVTDIYATAGIDITWGTLGSVDVPSIVGLEPESAEDVDAIIEALTTAAAPIGTDALDVFILADLDFLTGEFGPRTPGLLPPDPGGAVLAFELFREQDTGRVVAHMLGHYLGLPHLEVETDDGSIVPDPFADTEPDTGNIMDNGSLISEQQAAALLAHPLISP